MGFEKVNRDRYRLKRVTCTNTCEEDLLYTGLVRPKNRVYTNLLQISARDY